MVEVEANDAVDGAAYAPLLDQAAITAKARSLYRGLSLAPMVRASTTPLRALALQYGADYVYTEELVDRSILETIRVENKELGTIDYIKDPEKLSKKVKKKLQAQNNRPCLIMRIDPKLEGGKLVCQLGSGEADLALKAAKHVYRDVSAIDINMGCPKKFSVSGGMGSALLDDPERAAKIIAALKKEIPLPISCKIRLLKDGEQTVAFIEKMLAAGADALAIHARRVGHEATEKADWKTLEEVLAVVQPKFPDFPFLINGDFYDREERTEMMERTKARGILLARPALHNMSTFLPIDQPLVNKTQVVQEYLRLVIRYDMHYKNTKYVICEMMSNRRTPIERVLKMPIVFPGGQTIGSTCACHDFESICRLWGLDYEKELNSVRDATNTAVKLGGTHTTSSMPTMAAGEHKYDDSYFLHKNSVGRGGLEVYELDKLASNPCASTCNEEQTPSKRAKLETVD
jgi:tRNA-dihydrouridine synthase 2